MQDATFKPKSFLFDLNGTMINDMDFHAVAWHGVLTEDLGSTIAFEDVKKEMYGKNEELLARIFGAGHFNEEQLLKISMDKENRYQSAFLPHLQLIDGLHQFLEKGATVGITMAIGSAAIPFNIDFVLDGLEIRSYFDAIVSAHDVKTSKPHPETFLNAAAALGTAPADCLVFEDVPKGVESARNAGMKCIVITSTHSVEEFKEFDNILGFVTDYNDPILNNLF
jgi:HAD superfamily hydrolase (TIGR01509 family)